MVAMGFDFVSVSTISEWFFKLFLNRGSFFVLHFILLRVVF
jgi:hypothetical protein